MACTWCGSSSSNKITYIAPAPRKKWAVTKWEIIITERDNEGNVKTEVKHEMFIDTPAWQVQATHNGYNMRGDLYPGWFEKDGTDNDKS